MQVWNKFLAEVHQVISSFETDILFFRGHSNEYWELKPSLARVEHPDKRNAENLCYCDFYTRAGNLLPADNNSWDTLFAMQHHGVPTRLLDWSENFSVALHFALKGMKDNNGCIWIMNPFKLNELATNEPVLFGESDLGDSYVNYYIDQKNTLKCAALAFSPNRHNPRVFHQRSGFTLHDNLEKPLDCFFPEALKKIIIPNEVKKDALQFQKLAGTNEFSLFPDLDGLARLVNSEIFKIES
jgi:FRG domain